MRARSRGFTLLELAVVVAVVALLIAVGLERMLRYAEQAERSAMEQSVSAMKSALGMRFAALYVQGRYDALDALSRENPMDWLAEKPPGYLGPLWDPPFADLERPAWYYDRARAQLVYLPLRTRHLVLPADGDPRIRFQVVADFRPSEANRGRPELERLSVDPVAPYRWLEASE